nr:MAG TPA: hypothetical protein [Caudoviricetes sp.]
MNSASTRASRTLRLKARANLTTKSGSALAPFFQRVKALWLKPACFAASRIVMPLIMGSMYCHQRVEVMP